MRPLRTYLALFLAFCLALTAHMAASARGQGTGEQAILCTGAGVVVVYLDAEGTPTGPPHYCPDCSLHLLDAPACPVLHARPLDVARPLQPVVTPQVKGAVQVVHALQARAPPQRV
ncbi:hypothetical protein [Tritonibacter multivorans]|uniref:hypothetical protein n=1 Tax=Tritonibacter multivorans TaxID=928856 RepID=UPI000944AFED|nr:hypothetical protein [Tritonibacter multivorans]MDA7421806.1 hypothetical protein [Tritonibacter multivorans]